jgi:hypothetical protein
LAAVPRFTQSAPTQDEPVEPADALDAALEPAGALGKPPPPPPQPAMIAAVSVASSHVVGRLLDLKLFIFYIQNFNLISKVAAKDRALAGVGLMQEDVTRCQLALVNVPNPPVAIGALKEIALWRSVMDFRTYGER